MANKQHEKGVVLIISVLILCLSVIIWRASISSMAANIYLRRRKSVKMILSGGMA